MTTTTETKPDTTKVPVGPHDFIHIVSDTQHWLWVLGVKVPRSLCGVSLASDPNKPGPSASAPRCPACVMLNRRRPRR